jgi:hypothetical protein
MSARSRLLPLALLLASAAVFALGCKEDRAPAPDGGGRDAQSDPCACGDGKTVADTQQGLTWIADANLASKCTFGVANIDPGGSMSWSTAMNWVAALNACGYGGYHDWTLPETPTSAPDACSVKGFAFHCTQYPMANLFAQLGGKEGDTVAQLDFAGKGFSDFQPYLYWSSTQGMPGAYSFSFGNDFYGTTVVEDASYAIAYRPPLAPPAASPPANTGIGATANPTLTPHPLFATPDGQLLNDPELGIAWLADANLAQHPPAAIQAQIAALGIRINADGSMKYPDATNFITALKNASYLSHADWRLPLTPTSADASCTLTKNDPRFGYDCLVAEMGALFYEALAGAAGSPIQSIHGPQLSLFSNLQAYLYWADGGQSTGTDGGAGDGQPTFSFATGFEGGNHTFNEMYVLPVVPMACATAEACCALVGGRWDGHCH